MTGGFLSEIAQEVRASVLQGTYAFGERSPGRRPAPSLAAAIGRAPGGRGLIVEYKRNSPGREPPVLPRRSIGEFVDRTSVEPVLGYSCLATVPRFDGNPALVGELVRSTPRPVLFKDFVLGEAQVDAAARLGASAVLLIARLERAALLDAPLARLAERAHAQRLEVLVELHGPEDLAVLETVPADLVGVNVRDLDTLRIEVPTALETLRTLRARGVAPLLGLSGVEGVEDALRFWRAGCSAIVVGSAVALAADPASFLRSLLPPEERP